MPREGWKNICVSEEIYELARKKGDKQRRSVSNYVSNLIEDDKQ